MEISLTTIKIFLIILFASFFAQAQIDAETSSGRPRNEPLPQSIKETMAKQRIEEDKKDYADLIEMGGEAVELSKQIEKSYTKNKKLTSQDKSKLKDLEKLLKKMRRDLGGEGTSDEELLEEKYSLSISINALRSGTEKLFDEIKQTSRHTISAVAIGSSNTVLAVVKFLRFWK